MLSEEKKSSCNYEFYKTQAKITKKVELNGEILVHSILRDFHARKSLPKGGDGSSFSNYFAEGSHCILKIGLISGDISR